MKWYAVALGAALAAAGGTSPTAPAQEAFTEKPAFCEPGFEYVRQVELREVEHPCCKVVPIKRTRWVYCTKPGYYCVPQGPCCGHARADGCAPCEGGTVCNGPFCKPLLLKKKVEYECGTRCQVEMVKELVPTVVWRKVPCGTARALPGTVPAPAATPPGGLRR